MVESVKRSPGSEKGHEATATESALKKLAKWMMRKTALQAVFLVLVAAGVMLKFVILPWVASATVQGLADAYGVDAEVADWTADLGDLSATAHDLVVRVDGPYEEKELLTVDSVELDLSLWGGLLRDRWVREVRLRKPNLYMERLLSGRWNWHELGDLPSLAASGDGPSLASTADNGEVPTDFSLRRVVVEEMSLRWVENVPAESGDGLILSQKASLFLDDMHLTLDDVQGLVDRRPRSSRVALEARTGDGRISFNGQGNMFRWGAGLDSQVASGAGDVLAAADASRAVEWTPSVGATLYLENIAAGALARLTPQASILPTGGTFSGEVKVDVAERGLSCTGDLQMQSVKFTLNRVADPLRNRRAELERSLQAFEANGVRTFDCGGDLRNQEFRPMQGFQTQLTRSAVDPADEVVRVAAALDHQAYTGEPVDAEIEDWLARWIPPALLDRMDGTSGTRSGGARGRLNRWSRRIRGG